MPRAPNMLDKIYQSGEERSRKLDACVEGMVKLQARFDTIILGPEGNPEQGLIKKVEVNDTRLTRIERVLIWGAGGIAASGATVTWWDSIKHVWGLLA